jgi:hypothetical protein
MNNTFKLEVSFEYPSLVAPLSWQVDGIVGHMNTLFNLPVHVDHGDAIYQGIGCHLGYVRHHYGSAKVFDFHNFAA